MLKEKKRIADSNIPQPNSLSPCQSPLHNYNTLTSSFVLHKSILYVLVIAIFFFFLAVLGLSCSTKDRQSSLRHVDCLVIA